MSKSPPPHLLVERALALVPDASLREAAESVPVGPIVLHCSGGAGFDVLRPHRPAGYSFHPVEHLQQQEWSETL